MKKLINNPDEVVKDMISGLLYAYPSYLRKLDNVDVVVRKASPIKGKVGLVSGGGSGHEPTHAGYVGYGMLDAACCGAVFTSPTPDQVYEAIKAVDGGKGVLLVIKNYTGDVMNFEMAKEMAEMDGIKVDEVIVNDDVAVENSTYTQGRRGIAGTIFVHKIAGAKAEEGAELEEVKEVAEKVINNLRSMGMAFTPCIVPAAGKPSFTLEEDEIEIGIGIHGEPGTHREKIKGAKEIVAELMDRIVSDLPYEKDDEVALMINGLGSTPLSELFIANKEANEYLMGKNINVYKTYIGEYMTSLEMSGFSISLLKLDEELKSLLDASSDTPAFKQLK